MVATLSHQSRNLTYMLLLFITKTKPAISRLPNIVVLQLQRREPPVQLQGMFLKTPLVTAAITTTSGQEHSSPSFQRSTNEDVSVLTGGGTATLTSPADDTVGRESSSFLHLNDDGWDDEDMITTDAMAPQTILATTHPTLQPVLTTNAPVTVPLRDAGYTLFSKPELSHLRIMEFCDAAGCPRVFFDGLINLMKEETINNQLDFTAHVPKRESLIQTLLTACPTPLPVAIPVSLENDSRVNNPIEYCRGHRDVVHTMTFDFVEQLKDLLSDTYIFGNLSNLDVNPNDPFGKFERDDGCVDEVNSGSWYNNAHSFYVQQPNDEFLLPIIFYIDKTGTGRSSATWT